MITFDSKRIKKLFTAKEEIEAHAKEISEKAPQQFRQATYLYFLARYLVIYFEANFAELPVQVWNEYRNALDHYFRSITNEDQEEAAKHMTKMEGHIQRAVLDICKIICHQTEERFEATLKLETNGALRLVNNGDFYPQLHQTFKNAKDAFLSAKTCDASLGDGASKDRQIVGQYLEAFYAYRKAECYLDENRGNISKAEEQVRSLQHQGSVHHIRDSIIAKAIWYGPLALLYAGAGVLYFKSTYIQEHFKPLIETLKSYFH